LGHWRNTRAVTGGSAVSEIVIYDRPARRRHESTGMKRNRILYFMGWFVVIVLGLLWRRFGRELPEFLALYAGDTLWALMIFLGVGFLFARWPTRRVVIVALLFCYVIEVSQLYHAPWIDKIRNTWLGGLILGFEFHWSDIACYTVGVMLGGLLETLTLKRSAREC